MITVRLPRHKSLGTVGSAGRDARVVEQPPCAHSESVALDSLAEIDDFPQLGSALRGSFRRYEYSAAKETCFDEFHRREQPLCHFRH